MNKKHEFHISIGLSSMLLVFVVLCLVSFSVLSLVTANYDNNLSQKILDRNTSYQKICNYAESDLKQLDEKLYNIYINTTTENDYIKEANLCVLEFIYPISEFQGLKVTTVPHYPDNENSHLYEILQWQVITTQIMEYDESLNVLE